MLRSSRIAAALAAAALTLSACATDSAGDADASGDAAAQSYTIGVSQIVSHPALDAAVEGFQEGLANQGFEKVTYDVQNAQGDISTASSIAQKFANDDLDLVLGVATPTSQAIVKSVTDTPIVFTAVTDPVGAGLVEDAGAPKGNVTGVSDLLPMAPTLELIERVLPDLETLGVLYNAGESNSVFLIEEQKKAAESAGITIVEATASNSSEVKAAADSLVGRVDAISVLTDNTVVSALESVVKVAQENQIPLFAGDTDSVARGAIAAYAFDYFDLGVQAGEMAAEILAGKAIEEIPVEYAEKLQLTINEEAAAKTGVTLPDDVVAEATATS